MSGGSEKKRISELICQYLNGSGASFIPETWREGAACVSLTGGYQIYREYVDGSIVGGIPFDIRVRTPRGSLTVTDKLNVASFYNQISEYLRATPFDLADDISVLGITSDEVPYKSSVYDNGAEEYRVGYVLRFFKKPAEK